LSCLLKRFFLPKDLQIKTGVQFVPLFFNQKNLK